MVLSIVIPTWNLLHFTKQCVESIQKTMTIPYELIFVDNGSTDGTIDWLKHLGTERDIKIKPKQKIIKNHLYDKFPHLKRVKVVEANNIGFASACNRGIEASRGGFVILLNNDTICAPNWALNLYVTMRGNSKYGLIGATTNYVGQSLQYFPNHKCVKPALIPSPDLCFVCVIVNKRLWEQVKLDENYISGVEDIDYCWEAQKRGWKIGVCLGSFIYHIGSRTNKEQFGDERMKSNLKKGWEYFAKKWGDAGKERAGDWVA